MKKLIIGITAPGSVILLEGQLKYFREQGFTTYLMAPSHEKVTAYCAAEGCIHLPVKIEREISLLKDLKSLVQVLAHLRRVKPDIVNFGTPKISLVGMIAARMLGVKRRIYTCRGFRFEHEKGFRKMLLVTMERITAFFAQDVICISDSVRNYGVANRIFPARKALVINKGSSNGIPLKRFNPATINPDNTRQLKQQLGLDGYFVFGYVGRLVDRKGINELFAAFEMLYTGNNRLRLLFVGSPEFEQIADKALIDRMKAHDGIVMAGSQRDVPLYLSVMDVFVLPAWWEGFGNVLVQAAAMGKAVISTTGTGTIDAVDPDFNGILVKPKSVNELKVAMERLFEDEPLRKKLGTNGITWAENFDSPIIWEGMEALYGVSRE
ncbi:MAG: glycosyltransferase family 4 protein [Bacteroidota bacterium]